MYKNIVFDMGNVILKFEPDKYIDKLGIKDENLKKKIYRETYNTSKNFFLDRGDYTEEMFIDEVAKNLPPECKSMVEKLVLHWNDEIVPIEGMADLLKELKEKGYKLFLLSNASYRQPEYFNRTPGHEYFDGKIVSFQVKQVKPDKEIYEALYKTYNLNPKECYFIDDLQVNIYGGMKTGMDGYVFDGDVDLLREHFKNIGVL